MLWTAPPPARKSHRVWVLLRPPMIRRRSQDANDHDSRSRHRLVAPVGRNGVEHLLNIVADCSDERLPDVARACVAALGAQLRMLKARILGRVLIKTRRSDVRFW